MLVSFYDETDVERAVAEGVPLNLDEDELAYIRELLQHERLEEEDAELILAVMKERSDKIAEAIYGIAADFPHLAKSVYQFCRHLEDHRELSYAILDIVRSRSCQEYQLFWFSYILEKYLLDTPVAAELIDVLYNHKNASIISRAKILEIPDNRYGLTELRDEQLGAGQSDWLAWAAAVGHRNLPKLSRQHRLTYFGKASEMNNMISCILQRI